MSIAELIQKYELEILNIEKDLMMYHVDNLDLEWTIEIYRQFIKDLKTLTDE